MSERSPVSTCNNALDSLRRIPFEVPSGGIESPCALKGVLWWGWHAVALLAHLRLGTAREEFDAWLWSYLPEEGDPALDAERDARWEERERLSLLEVIDLLSSEELSMLKPEFYQGWQDRRTRCRTLRWQAGEVLGRSIDGEQREALLLLLAAYHRLLRLPAAVELHAGALVAALPTLFDLLEMLVDRSDAEAEALLGAIEDCRRALP